MKFMIQLMISLAIIFGGSRFALIKAHDLMRELAFKKISKGLSKTSDLNKMLRGGADGK